MDLKQKKPVHLKCPKCGHDFSCNTNRIEEDYNNLKIKATSIKARLTAMKSKNMSTNSPEYKRLKALEADTVAQITAIKKARTAMNREMEVQKYMIFKNLVKGILGEEKTIALLKEAEEEMVFREYEMAIQKSTNFDGA